MATTAMLPSEDCLLRPNNSFHYKAMASPLFNRHLNPNPNAPSKISRQRKRSPVGPPCRNRGQDRTSVAGCPAKNLIMGQVKILKRGEELRPPQVPDKKDKKGRGFGEADLVVCSTDRLGPEPETVQKQIRVSDLKLYAGSAAVLASPPPSSVPFPGFFAKKRDSASSDLRRLLRLDLV